MLNICENMESQESSYSGGAKSIKLYNNFGQIFRSF